jgi:hypothetical protein
MVMITKRFGTYVSPKNLGLFLRKSSLFPREFAFFFREEFKLPQKTI